MARKLQLLVSARSLASMAGVSAQVVRSRIESGELSAVAYMTNGSLLFKPSDAKILAKKFQPNTPPKKYNVT